MQSANTLALPVLVLERETGRLLLLDSPDEVRRFAEEFWDILKADFAFWDGQCRTVNISAAFVAGTTTRQLWLVVWLLSGAAR